MSEASEPYFQRQGYCPACESETLFVADGAYFRNTLKCVKCKSVPRNRVLMHVLSKYFPSWNKLRIHESSPGWDIVSQRLAKECEQYVASQYDPNIALGSLVDAPRLPCKRYFNQNLESQTFLDNEFDLVITQDVFEHIFFPDLAIKDIARTLKVGGATLMTVPIVRKNKPSRRRAALVGGEVHHLVEPAQYHGNPISGKGALVTVDWGYDIVSYLQHHSGMAFQMIQVENLEHGIAGDLIEVLLGFKVDIARL